MSAISTAGGRTGRLVNARLVRRRLLPHVKTVATSLRRRCSVGSITYPIGPNDQPNGDFAPCKGETSLRDVRVDGPRSIPFAARCDGLIGTCRDQTPQIGLCRDALHRFANREHGRSIGPPVFWVPAAGCPSSTATIGLFE